MGERKGQRSEHILETRQDKDDSLIEPSRLVHTRRGVRLSTTTIVCKLGLGTATATATATLLACSICVFVWILISLSGKTRSKFNSTRIKPSPQAQCIASSSPSVCYSLFSHLTLPVSAPSPRLSVYVLCTFSIFHFPAFPLSTFPPF